MSELLNLKNESAKESTNLLVGSIHRSLNERGNGRSMSEPTRTPQKWGNFNIYKLVKETPIPTAKEAIDFGYTASRGLTEDRGGYVQSTCTNSDLLFVTFVFDGHGGNKVHSGDVVSNYANDRTKEFFSTKQWESSDIDYIVSEILQFIEVLRSEVAHYSCGSTLNITIFNGDGYGAAITMGDSMTIIFNEFGSIIDKTTDDSVDTYLNGDCSNTKATNLPIVGTYFNNALAMYSAIGDSGRHDKWFVALATPRVRRFFIPKGGFILVTSDGLMELAIPKTTPSSTDGKFLLMKEQKSDGSYKLAEPWFCGYPELRLQDIEQLAIELCASGRQEDFTSMLFNHQVDHAERVYKEVFESLIPDEKICLSNAFGTPGSVMRHNFRCSYDNHHTIAVHNNIKFEEIIVEGERSKSL